MPGVSTPITVKSPMMPKMKAPIRIRSVSGRSGTWMPESPDSLSEAVSDGVAAAGAPLPSNCATIAATPSSTPRSKSPTLN